VTSPGILTINVGSSSLKFSVWRLTGRYDLQEALRGEIEKIGTAPHLAARIPAGDTLLDKTFGDGAGLSHEVLRRNSSPSGSGVAAMAASLP